MMVLEPSVLKLPLFGVPVKLSMLPVKVEPLLTNTTTSFVKKFSEPERVIFPAKFIWFPPVSTLMVPIGLVGPTVPVTVVSAAVLLKLRTDPVKGVPGVPLLLSTEIPPVLPTLSPLGLTRVKVMLFAA